MGYFKANHTRATSIIAAMLGAALVGGTLLNPATTIVAQAQTEPATAANGVVLPPQDFDPAAARNEELIASAVVPEVTTTPVSAAEESTITEAPEAAPADPEGTADDPEGATDAPEDGSATTANLGGSDVAVSSVGGSYEVDRPRKRSDRKR
jgi:hypothetical protein